MKAVIFDMDGVLIDSLEAWFRLFNSALKHFRFKEITKKDFVEKAWATPIQTDAQKFFPGIKIKGIADFFSENFMEEYLKINPGTKEVLEKLKSRGIKIGLFTNTFSKLTEHILDHFEIKKFFDVIVTGDDVKIGKPDPEGILIALKSLNIKPNEAVYVGDSVYDREAARNAKVKFVGYKIDGDEKINSLVELITPAKINLKLSFFIAVHTLA